VPVLDASGGQVATTSAPLEADKPDPDHEAQEADSLDAEEALQALCAQVGLGSTNPFAQWDAGSDPDLSRYLVGHDVLRVIWRDGHAAVFAPLGGGKSAFRVRLAYACRVEEDGRRVFPILYLAPRPEDTSLDAHLQAIVRNAAQELLLALVYRPGRFAALDEDGQRRVRRILDENDPLLVAHFLPQIERAGTLAPLVETLDPSARRLPAQASPDQVRALCAALRALPSPTGSRPAAERFADLIDVLRRVHDYQAVYVLVDGVDASLNTAAEPERAVAMLQPLLVEMPAWRKQQVFLKLFLPLELRKPLVPLTRGMKTAIIKWNPALLTDVLRARLKVASRGEFDSLDAVSGPSLRGAEAELLKAVPHVPRELLVAATELLAACARRAGSSGRLEWEDLASAIAAYDETQPPTP
jgi:hypothetical protein